MLNKIKALAGAALLIAAGATTASANCHSGPFSGAYIGASVGYLGHDGEQHPLHEAKLSGDDGSAVGGLHIGYNMQCGRMVFGIETDLNFLGTEVKTDQEGQPNPGYFNSSIDWYGTLRGRLGIAVHDDMLLYATAGLAYADLTHRLSGAYSDTTFSLSNSDMATGWVVGGGVEFLRHERWLFRAEALYVDLGSEKHDYTITTSGCGATTCYTNVDWKDSFWTVRVGLSYKLGGYAEHHESLK